MSRYFVEWESGQVEEINKTKNIVFRGGKREVWPEDWPQAVLSAVKIKEASSSSGVVSGLISSALWAGQLGLVNAALSQSASGLSNLAMARQNAALVGPRDVFGLQPQVRRDDGQS